MMQSRVLVVLVLAVLALLSGCANVNESIGPVSGWSRDRYEDASYEAAFDAGRYALEQWFRIESARADRGEIVTLADESMERAGTGRLRDETVGTRSRVRRRAAVRISRHPPGIIAECVVKRERLDTAEARAFAQQRSFSEAPTDTPIQGEAGASAEQSQVWTDIGRDRKLEREVLDVMRGRLLRESRPATRPAQSTP